MLIELTSLISVLFAFLMLPLSTFLASSASLCNFSCAYVDLAVFTPTVLPVYVKHQHALRSNYNLNHLIPADEHIPYSHIIIIIIKLFYRIIYSPINCNGYSPF